jgi:hypothetical protein
MKWTVILHDDFKPEFHELSAQVQDELLAPCGYVEGFEVR